MVETFMNKSVERYQLPKAREDWARRLDGDLQVTGHQFVQGLLRVRPRGLFGNKREIIVDGAEGRSTISSTYDAEQQKGEFSVRKGSDEFPVTTRIVVEPIRNDRYMYGVDLDAQGKSADEVPPRMITITTNRPWKNDGTISHSDIRFRVTSDGSVVPVEASITEQGKTEPTELMTWKQGKFSPEGQEDVFNAGLQADLEHARDAMRQLQKHFGYFPWERGKSSPLLPQSKPDLLAQNRPH